MFWVNQIDGSIMQQDKFGRGVPVTLIKNLNNPQSVKVLHPYRYNNSIHDPCMDRHCSHLCVIVPGHRAKCECPDGQSFVDRQAATCDAASEPPLAQPLICKCRNGGICRDDTSCQCDPGFHGTYCENGKKPIITSGNSNTAAIVVPVFLMVIVILLSIGVYAWYRRGEQPKSFSNVSNSVSFRSGNNVEFSGPSFVNTGPSEGQHGETNPSNDFGLQDVTSDGKRDFSNPMYEAYGQLESQATADAITGNYSIPSGDSGASSASGSRGSPASTLAAGASGFSTEATPNFSAVLSPSSVIHKSSPQLAVRHKELAPSSVDTGKDTQCLVTEDDSEC
jgi:low density lipoprotein-related protein 2